MPKLAESLVTLATSEAAKSYIHRIKDLRHLVIGVFGLLMATTTLIVSFFIMVHTGLLVSGVPLEKIHLITALTAGVLFLGSLGSILMIFSEKLWIKVFKINELIDKVVD
ncbi:MAG: hypothetical protein SGI74_13595 [Oligoflexia bacterium]|nr:hypothetical protein [Oligoflexia bacterium]